MKTIKLLFAFLTLFASTTVVFAQEALSGTVGQIEDSFVSKTEAALVATAEAMPEDKYSFVPTNGDFKGVRSFADQVKHVAAANYGGASAILHEKPPVKLDTDADVDAITTKADIMKFLKGSFTYLHKAFRSLSEKNLTEQVPNPEGEGTIPKLDVATRFLMHNWDHYGQMVEYLRMNGIRPPGSH
jgi:DinB family protein